MQDIGAGSNISRQAAGKAAGKRQEQCLVPAWLRMQRPRTRQREGAGLVEQRSQAAAVAELKHQPDLMCVFVLCVCVLCVCGGG